MSADPERREASAGSALWRVLQQVCEELRFSRAAQIDPENLQWAIERVGELRAQRATCGPKELRALARVAPAGDLQRRLLADAAAQEAKPCEHCDGSGSVAVHVCSNEVECRRKCLRVEACMGCLGSGKAAIS